MRLQELTRRAYPERAGTAERLPDVEVTAVVQDARRAGPGALFVARLGARSDGHDFAQAAARAGAVAIAGGRGFAPGTRFAGLPYLPVPDDRAAVARLAAALHDWPARRTRVLGVTGTDGKTTTSTLLWWLLQGAAPTALSSTASTRLGDEELPPDGPFTTPEADAVQAFLAEAARRELARVVLESSSHGLALRRLDEIDYALAVWTTLSPEHLDFHVTFEAYRDAKAQLVRRAPHAVLNRDDEAYAHFAGEAGAVTSYGTDPRADWRLLQARPGPGRLELTVGAPDGRERSTVLPMVGGYNAGNALAAWAAAAHEGLDPDDAGLRLATFPGVPGRMQVIQAEPFALIVDFAHTAPALSRALEAAVPRGGRRIVVVGAAGERDPAKRAPLGAAAVRGADLAVLTEEDARSEDPAEILAAMAAGATAAGGREGRDFVRVADRRDAIRHAVASAGPGDVVLLAGKGHERTLARADELLAWDEAAEARSALETRGA